MACSKSFTNDEIRNRIRNIWSNFVVGVEPDRLSDWLVQEYVITPEQWQRIHRDNSTRESRCRALLHHLFVIPHPRAFLVVYQALAGENHYLLESIDNQKSASGISSQHDIGLQIALQENKIEYKVDPVLAKTFRTESADKFKKGISGLAIADSELFITTFHTKLIEVYDLTSLSLTCSWILDPLKNPWDVGYCIVNKCLYVMDSAYANVRKEMIRVDRSGKLLKVWTTGMSYGCLSVTYDCNVLMADYEGLKIAEYTPDGQSVREINLSTSAGFAHPRHAIKLTNGRYLMSHGEGEDPLHRVCVVDASGDIRMSFGGQRGSTSDRLFVPIYLAIDSNGSIFVVDRDNSRVLLLTSGLESKREIIPRKKEGMQRPERMAFDQVNGRLLLVHNDPNWSECRVFVFKIL